MDDTVLALFDPIYDDQPGALVLPPAHTLTPTLVSVRSPELTMVQTSQNDASDASQRTIDQAIINQVGERDPTAFDATAPSQPPVMAPAGTETRSTRSVAASSIAQLRLNGKPFIASRQPHGADPSIRSSPSYPSTRISAPLAAISVAGLRQIDQPGPRSVSLPMNLTDPLHTVHPKPHGRTAILTAVHTNRVVSLPEFPSTSSHLAGGPSQVSTLPTVDEMHPLIDLSSPKPYKSLSDRYDTVSSSPNGSIIIHSSFSKESEDCPSRSSSPDLSEESIIVSNPATGRSNSFLRRLTSDPSAGADANLHVGLEKVPAQVLVDNSAPKPIPALHGPPSLPYARCPSGAEGVMISEQASLPRMIWGLNDQSKSATVTPKTPSLPQVPFNEYQVAPTPFMTPASATSTPASTVVATPGSRGSVRQTPSSGWNRNSFTSSQPYTKYKQSILGSTSNQSPMQNRPRRGSIYYPHSKKTSISGKENVGLGLGLGSPLQLGTDDFSTPGGYTEYHYVENPDWQEFVPSSGPTQHNAPPPQSQQPRGILTPVTPATADGKLTRANTTCSQHLQPAISRPGDRQNPHFSPQQLVNKSAHHDASRAGASDNSSSIACHTQTTPSIFAIRKAPPPQPPRPKLRDVPAIVDLMANPSPDVSFNSPIEPNLGLMPSADILTLGRSMGITSEILAESLRLFWNERFAEMTAHLPAASNPMLIPTAPRLASETPSIAHARTSSLPDPPFPPGINIPSALLNAAAAASPAPTPAPRIPNTNQSPSVLGNARSIPIARLRNKSVSTLTPVVEADDEASPMPIINDLAAGLHVSKPTGPANVLSMKKAAIPSSSEVVHKPLGLEIMGAGIQASGPKTAPVMTSFVFPTRRLHVARPGPEVVDDSNSGNRGDPNMLKKRRSGPNGSGGPRAPTVGLAGGRASAPSMRGSAPMEARSSSGPSAGPGSGFDSGSGAAAGSRYSRARRGRTRDAEPRAPSSAPVAV